MSATPLTHVVLDAHGVAWIDLTKVKVIEVVQDHLAYGWSAEEIHRQHPDLSFAQIYSALGYYYDHQADFDRQIAASLEQFEKHAAATADSPFRRRLRLLRRQSA